MEIMVIFGVVFEEEVDVVGGRVGGKPFNGIHLVCQREFYFCFNYTKCHEINEVIALIFLTRIFERI